MRSSSACPDCAALEEAQSDSQQSCSQCAHSTCASTKGHAGPGHEERTARTRRHKQAKIKICLPPLCAMHRKVHVAAKVACVP